MIKINESWSLPQSSIKCNYCIQHTVKLLWCICWDIIYATYLQRGIDPTLWISCRGAVECKLKEIRGYLVWSIIWLIVTYFSNSAPYCTVFCDGAFYLWILPLLISLRGPCPLAVPWAHCGGCGPHQRSCRRRLKWPGRFGYYFLNIWQSSLVLEVVVAQDILHASCGGSSSQFPAAYRKQKQFWTVQQGFSKMHRKDSII